MIKKAISGLVAALLLWGAFALAKHGLWERKMGKQSLSWPDTEGIVLHSSIATYGTGSGSTSSGEVTYRYEVDKKSFENDRIRYGATGKRGGAFLEYGRLPVGDTIPVRYDPANPAESTLIAGPTGRSLGLLAGAGAIAIFGIGQFMGIAMNAGKRR